MRNSAKLTVAAALVLLAAAATAQTPSSYIPVRLTTSALRKRTKISIAPVERAAELQRALA